MPKIDLYALHWHMVGEKRQFGIFDSTYLWVSIALAYGLRKALTKYEVNFIHVCKWGIKTYPKENINLDTHCLHFRGLIEFKIQFLIVKIKVSNRSSMRVHLVSRLQGDLKRSYSNILDIINPSRVTSEISKTRKFASAKVWSHISLYYIKFYMLPFSLISENKNGLYWSSASITFR